MAELSDDERAKLIARLSKFEEKYDAMVLGESYKSVDYTSGSSGSRAVEFAKGDLSQIMSEIRAMRTQLGMTPPVFESAQSRRPIQIGSY